MQENVLKNFFNDRSRLVDMQYGLDNETFNWINGKVQAASLFNDNNLANDIINE